jgi:CheY-like chemotaxis protein
MHLRGKIAKPDHFARRIKVINGRLRLDVETEQPSMLDSVLVQEQIIAMQGDRYVEHAFGPRHAGDMVHMGVGQQNLRERDLLSRGKLEQAVDFVARIDEHALSRSGAGDDKSVFEEWADRLRLDYDHDVILAILDDLLFTSKMRATAKQIGATLTVAKSRESALAEMRATRPALVILDLNNPRTDPLGIMADIKGDPALAGIATVGFVSHVHTELIDAARKAGVGDVMARSMFAERLPQILARGI